MACVFILALPNWKKSAEIPTCFKNVAENGNIPQKKIWKIMPEDIPKNFSEIVFEKWVVYTCMWLDLLLEGKWARGAGRRRPCRRRTAGRRSRCSDAKGRFSWLSEIRSAPEGQDCHDWNHMNLLSKIKIYWYGEILHDKACMYIPTDFADVTTMYEYVCVYVGT
jgi:hypothetical protein